MQLSVQIDIFISVGRTFVVATLLTVVRKKLSKKSGHDWISVNPVVIGFRRLKALSRRRQHPRISRMKSNRRSAKSRRNESLVPRQHSGNPRRLVCRLWSRRTHPDSGPGSDDTGDGVRCRVRGGNREKPIRINSAVKSSDLWNFPRTDTCTLRMYFLTKRSTTNGAPGHDGPRPLSTYSRVVQKTWRGSDRGNRVSKPTFRTVVFSVFCREEMGTAECVNFFPTRYDCPGRPDALFSRYKVGNVNKTRSVLCYL